MERFAKIINGSIFARRSKEKAKSSVAKMARIEKKKTCLELKKTNLHFKWVAKYFTDHEKSRV